MIVPPSKWGSDHWSTFLYAETVIQDCRGLPDRRKMRCDPGVHPGLAEPFHWEGKQYPTRLKGDDLLEKHDDWSCLDDIEDAGFLIQLGSGINRILRLTDPGFKLAGELREFRAKNKTTKGFEPSLEVVTAGRMHARERDLSIGEAQEYVG